MSEARICKITGKPFVVSDKEAALCARMGVPLPEVSRTERIRALMGIRNEWKLYKRKCDKTGEDILSAYPPGAPFPVYTNEVWWGDGWDPLSYGRDFDFSRPFFEQFADLQKVVPREGTSIFNSENSEYNSHLRESKNCYLNSLVAKCEDTYYSYWMVEDKDVFDSMYTYHSTLAYECDHVDKGYQCVMLQESENCNECYFSFQLRGCDHVIFSSGLVNKSYFMFNQSCTKEQFDEIKGRLMNGSYARWQEAYGHFMDMKLKAKHRAVHNLNCENVSGDHCYNCRNDEDIFESFDAEDAVNCVSLSGAKDIMDIYSCGWPAGSELVYNSAVTRNAQNIIGSYYTWFSSNLSYCDSSVSSSDCFGSIGLKHKKFCILNKQYTEAEYKALVPKIIEHMKKTEEWGKFFPPSLSTFAYNETAAMDFFPLTKDAAVKLGYRWLEKDKRDYKPATLSALPDSLSDLRGDIAKEVLACADCAKNYKIIKQELAFYRQMNLPLPRLCPECRHKKRFALRNPLTLFDRKCDDCGMDIQSSYAPGRPEKIYCEHCYLKNIN